MENRQIKFIAEAVLWFDKTNGNTYHSARITRVKDGKTIAAPKTYGYGSMYEQTALNKMLSEKWLPKKYDVKSVFAYERENNYPIYWSVSNGTKKECITNGLI